jgi:dTMP kinase
MKSTFIVFAGCEGSGKSTQVERLQKAYPDVVFTREPGGSPFAEDIRAVMLKSANAKQADAFTQLCLAFASRRDHMKNTVIPALENGKHVASDRGDICSKAYQVNGMEAPELQSLYLILREEALGAHEPTLYVIFDIDPAEGMKRVAARQAAKGDTNHFDGRGLDFHGRVHAGYAEFATDFADKVAVIDASPSKDEVFAKLVEIVTPIWGEPKL